MVEYVNDAGFMAWPMLMFEMVLFPLGIALLFLYKKNALIRVYALLSLLPLILAIISGVINTYKCYPDHGFVLLLFWYPMKLALIFSLPLWIFTILAFALNRWKGRSFDSQDEYDSTTFSLFVRRGVASLIDSALFMVIIVVFMLANFWVFESESINPNMYYLVELFLKVFFYIVFLVYFIWMESSAKQATLGKLAMQLKVTDMDGNRPTFGQCVGRNLFKIISSWTIFIAYILMLFNKEQQMLHDMPAKCRVVSNKN